MDGTKNLNFELTESDVNTIKIELPENAKQMTIVGTKVVPEFGLLSVVVFGTAITTAILFHKSQIRFQK